MQQYFAEVTTLEKLTKKMKGVGFPLMLHTGISNKHRYIVMSALGPSLKTIHSKFKKKKLSVKTVVQIGLQLIDLL